MAIGTLALAVFTARLAARTTLLAKRAGEDVRAVSRPVLIDAADEAEPRLEVAANESKGTLKLRCRNAGPGPALNAYTYVYSATTGDDSRSLPILLGNVPPDHFLNLEVPGLVAVDPTSDDPYASSEPHLFFRVILVYSDIAENSFHSVIRLSCKPGAELRSVRPGDVNVESLQSHGTQVGEGDAPAQQWRVVARGRELNDEQRTRLRSQSIQYLSGHGVSGTWSSSLFLSADTSAEAKQRVTDALGAEAGVVVVEAKPWSADPFVFRRPTALEALKDRVRAVTRRRYW